MKLKNNENLVVLGLFLGATGLLSALVLAVFSGLTAEPIAKAEMRRENQALLQVLPAFDNNINEKKLKIKTPAGWDVTLRAAKKDGRLCGYAADCINPRGYAGNIRMLAGLTPDGKIRALLITEQKETPGLGAEVCKREFRKTIFNLTSPVPEGLPPNVYLDHYNNKTVPAGGWKVQKDGGDAPFVTGATVTSRAIAHSASEIALAFQKHQREITAAFTGGVK